MAGPLNEAELSKLRHRVTVASGDVLSYNEIIIRELLDTIDVLKADRHEALRALKMLCEDQVHSGYDPGKAILAKHGMEVER